MACPRGHTASRWQSRVSNLDGRASRPTHKLHCVLDRGSGPPTLPIPGWSGAPLYRHIQLTPHCSELLSTGAETFAPLTLLKLWSVISQSAREGTPVPSYLDPSLEPTQPFTKLPAALPAWRRAPSFNPLSCDLLWPMGCEQRDDVTSEQKLTKLFLSHRNGTSSTDSCFLSLRTADTGRVSLISILSCI